MLQQSPITEIAGHEMAVANTQPRRLQIALVLLLVALAVVIVKDREFWFDSDEAVVSEPATSPVSAKTNATPMPGKAAQSPVATAPAVKKHVASAKVSAKAAVVEPSHQVAAAQSSVAAPSTVVSTTRATLPPLDVEVIAGDTHRTVHPGSNVAKVAIPGGSSHVAAATTSAVSLTTNAAEHERLSAGAVPELRQTVDANYPLLGQHMQVQGSVVLQAVVGADGNIENLRVISGPAILTAAAQQAVRQWRFKPYMENGQPVETKARITVNFSIRISDNPANAS